MWVHPSRGKQVWGCFSILGRIAPRSQPHPVAFGTSIAELTPAHRLVSGHGPRGNRLDYIPSMPGPLHTQKRPSPSRRGGCRRRGARTALSVAPPAGVPGMQAAKVALQGRRWGGERVSHVPRARDKMRVPEHGANDLETPPDSGTPQEQQHIIGEAETAPVPA